MFGNEITILEAVIVCAFSLIMVFMTLLAISYLIDLTAWITRKIEKKAENTNNDTIIQSTDVKVEKDDSEKVLLAAAAIAAYLDTTADKIIVHQIRRVADTETCWMKDSRIDSLR